MRYPFIIDCPFTGSPPTSVSLVEFPCDQATNKLTIINRQPANGLKKRFAVCSKTARFENRDFAVRFIEWVQMILILGAEKIFFSYEYVHPEMFKIINYFERKGVIEAWPHLNPTGISDSKRRSWQAFQLEVNAQTDCFYKVMNLYDFVAFLDFDELIVPVLEGDLTWEDLIRRANVTLYKDAYVSQNVYYPEVGAKPIKGIPTYMYMLQHVQRSQNFSKFDDAIKSIFGTEKVVAVHTHEPYKCINRHNEWCNRYHFPRNVSQNSHYRDHMDKEEFNVTIEDRTLWKYKDRLMKAVYQTLSDLNFSP